jgi:uncharacterized protein
MMRNCLYLLVSLLIGCANAQTEQKVIWVLDMEGLFTPEQIQQLDDLVKDHERRTTNEIAIVTTATIEPHERMKDHAVELGNKAGVGKHEKDNGLLVMISRTHRETFISTGKGIQETLPDEQVKLIVDSVMIPHFKEGRYFEGTYAGTEAVAKWLEEH